MVKANTQTHTHLMTEGNDNSRLIAVADLATIAK